MILRSTQALRGRRLIIVAGLAASTLLAGCDRDTATSRAVDDARMQLLAMSSGETLTPPGHRAAVYQNVLTQLRPVASQGTSSQNAAASLLIAQVQAGLAEAPMGAAAELEAQTLHGMNEVRSMLSQWLVLNAAATAAASYDPAPELNSIQQQIRAGQQRISEADAAKAEVEARTADLRQQAQKKLQDARSLRQESARLRQQVANQTATEGEQTLMKAREIVRRADAMEVEAAELDARAEQIEPQIVEATTRAEGVRTQLEALEAATREVQQRGREAVSEAQEARKSAADVASELHAALQELEKLRSGELAQQYEAAINGYQESAASARKALSENRVAANLAIGTAQQAIGALQWGRSHGMAFYDETLSALAEAKPALPQAQQYRQMTQRTATARQEALDAATEAFSAAFDAYKAAGAGDRMDRVNAALGLIVSTTSGGSRDLGAGMALETDPLPEMEWTGPTSPGATPQETLASFVAGISSLDAGVIDLFHFETAEQREAAESVASIFPAAKRFMEAMSAQFGDGVEAGLMNMASQAPGFSEFGEFDPYQADVSIDGETAELRMDDGNTMTFRQVDGTWLIDASEFLEGEEIEALLAMVPQIRQAFEDLAADVESGKFNSEQEAFSAFMMKLMTMDGFGGG